MKRQSGPESRHSRPAPTTLSVAEQIKRMGLDRPTPTLDISTLPEPTGLSSIAGAVVEEFFDQAGLHVRSDVYQSGWEPGQFPVCTSPELLATFRNEIVLPVEKPAAIDANIPAPRHWLQKLLGL